MTTPVWTDDRIVRLRTLWLEGRTADVIAQDLGCGISRNAVLGKVYRMGLSAERVPRTRKVPAPKVVIARLTGTRVPDHTRSSLQAPDPECGTRTVLSVGSSDCRWPLGDPALPGFSLCGGPVARGSFCTRHAEMAYRPRPQKPQSLERLAGLDF